MKKQVYSGSRFKFNESKLVRTEEAEPECGVDMCDLCGDCLHCYGHETCLESRNGNHLWVVYEDDIDKNENW